MLLVNLSYRGARIVGSFNGDPVAEVVSHRSKVSMATDQRLGVFIVSVASIDEPGDEAWPTSHRS